MSMSVHLYIWMKMAERISENLPKSCYVSFLSSAGTFPGLKYRKLFFFSQHPNIFGAFIASTHGWKYLFPVPCLIRRSHHYPHPNTELPPLQIRRCSLPPSHPRIQIPCLSPLPFNPQDEAQHPSLRWDQHDVLDFQDIAIFRLSCNPRWWTLTNCFLLPRRCRLKLVSMDASK